jgi:hypothetical protein
MISKYQFPRDLSEEFKKIYFLAYETLNRDFGSMDVSTDTKKNAGLLNTTDTVYNSNLKAIIALPMPEQFGDDLVHTWEKKDTLESLDAGAASATDAMIGVAALSSIFKSIQGFAAPLIGTLSLSKVVTGFLNAGKSPSVGLMSMFSGARKTLVNPDYWQNYTGSDPRTFEFKYIFQPRSREEATEVLNILRVFKMLSSPRLENVPNSGSLKDSIIGIFKNTIKPNESEGSSTLSPNQAEEIQKGLGTELSNFLEGKTNQSLQNLSNAQSFVGAIKQPHYWKIVLGNNHLNNLTKMTELVCNKVGISFGSSKMEVFSDGIPKIMELSLSFAEIKLKYENDFETPFTTNDKANSDEYNNIVEAHDNAVKAQQKEQAEQKAKEAEQKAKEQKEQEAKAAAEKEENEKRALAERAQKKLEAWISGNSATAKGVKTGFGMMGSRYAAASAAAAAAKKPNLHRENVSYYR